MKKLMMTAAAAVAAVSMAMAADKTAADLVAEGKYVEALRNINARYTIKLYDDRATWEPILSKIRAMIDVR